MKLPKLRITWAALLTAVAVVSARADYPGTVLSQGPAAYYRLNETTAPPPLTLQAVNIGSVGAAGNGEFRNGVERAVAGAIVSDPSNLAVYMPGAEGNRVRIPNNEAWNSETAISVEFWAKPGQTNALACPAASVEFIAGPPAQRNGWLFYQGDTTLTGGNGWLFRYYNNSSLTAVSGAAVTMELSTDQWYHVVGVYDGTNIKIYVNGVERATSVFTSTPRGNTNPDIPLTFGARADGVSGYWNYQGSIDEAAVYTTALSPERILAHYEAGIAAAPATPYQQLVQSDAPAGYWRLSEAGDAFAVNAGTLGSAADARIIAPTTVAVAGPTGPGFETGNKAFQFTTGGFVQAPPLDLNTNGVTITCWAKPSGAQAEHAGIVFHRARLATGASGTTAGLKMDAVAGLNLSYNWDGDMATYNWNSELALTDGEWNFVALIVHPNKAVLFVPSNPNYLPITRQGYDINHAVLEFEGSTYIGMDPMTDNTTTTRKFVGAVDEVAIFDRALSIGETYTQYAAAVGSLAPKIFADPVAPVDPVYAGDSVTLTVDAGGTPDLTYAWRKNGTPIANATSSSLTIPSLAASDAGDYTVAVNNSFGQAVSAPASLYVLNQETPSFYKDIAVASRTLYPGGTIKLGVVAMGGGLTYTWKKNGTPIANATGPDFVLSNITADDAGTYLVTVSNAAGTTDSASTTIAIAAPAAGSYDAEVAADTPRAWFRMDDPADAELMLDATGRFDGYYTNRLGTPVTLGAPGALVGNDNTAATFLHTDQAWGETYPPPVAMGDYTYECWVRTDDTTTFLSPLSSFRSQYGVVLWKDAATWRSGDGYGDLDVGVNVRSSAVGGAQAGKWMHFVITYSSGGAHRTYVNGVWDGNAYIDHSRNRNTPLRIGAYDPVVGGENVFWTGQIDEVAVYDKALTEERILAHYQAGVYPSTKPFFIREPVTEAVLPSASVTFEAQADGSFPIAYQWFKNGTAIEGATSATYTVTASSTPSGPDEYYVRASNPVGEALSRIATLTVLPPEPASWNATKDLVLHMKFDGDTKDASGRNNDGTAVGAPAMVAGLIGQALHYNTDTDTSTYNYVKLGAPADLRFGTDVDFSVAYWVRMPQGALPGDLPVLCSATNSYGNPGLTFAPSYELGGWSFSLNGIAQVYGPDGSINDGNWHHLVHAVNRKGNVVTYLNGVQVDTRSASTLASVDTTSGVFNIGQDPTGEYGETGEADIDDLGVWRRTLTAYDAYAIHYVGRTHGSSFDSATAPTLSIGIVEGKPQIAWDGAGTVEQADSLLGPWTTVPGATSPYTVEPVGAGKFFRVKQ